MLKESNHIKTERKEGADHTSKLVSEYTVYHSGYLRVVQPSDQMTDYYNVNRQRSRKSKKNTKMFENKKGANHTKVIKTDHY